MNVKTALKIGAVGKDKKAPINIRLTVKACPPTYVKLCHRIEPKFWIDDKGVKEVKACPEHDIINTEIERAYKITKDTIKAIQVEGLEFDSHLDLKAYIEHKVNGINVAHNTKQNNTNPEHGSLKRTMRFTDYCDFVMKREKAEYKEKTDSNYSYRIDKIKDFTPDIRLNEINGEWCYDYKSYILDFRKNSWNTFCGDFALLRKFLLCAVEDELIPKNPIPKKLKFVPTEEDKDFLTIDELNRALDLYNSKVLLSVVSKDKRGKTYPVGIRYQYILQQYLIGCFSGLRAKDVKKLNAKEHLRIFNNRLVVDMGKVRKHKKKTVKIPLSPQLKQVLNMKTEGKLYDGTLVVGTKTNRTINYIMYEFLGIRHKNLSFHTSRRTFGVCGLTLGMPLETVQAIMGHSDIRTTQRYSKIVDEKLDKDMEVWKAMAKRNIDVTDRLAS